MTLNCEICEMRLGRSDVTVECFVCKQQYHNTCLESPYPTEVLKLQGFSHRCNQCLSGDNTESDNTIKKLLVEMNNKIDVMQSNIGDLRSTQTNLQVSIEFLGGKIDDFNKKMIEMENSVKEIPKIESKVTDLNKQVCELKSSMNILQQQARMNNLEINNIPEKCGNDLRIVNNSGFGALVAKKFESEAHFDWSCDGIFEDLWVEIKLQASVSILLCCVYAPPESSVENLNAHLNKISRIVQMCPAKKCVILGDYNASKVKWIFDSGDSCYVPSEISGLYGFLDLVFSNFINVSVTRSVDPFVVERVTQHKCIDILIDTNIQESLKGKSSFEKLKYRYANCGVINVELSRIPWLDLFKDLKVEDCVHIFYERFYGVVTDSVPKKKVNNKFPTWYIPSTRSLIKEKYKLHQRWKKYNNPVDYVIFSKLRRKVRAAISTDYKNYVKNTEKPPCDTVVLNFISEDQIRIQLSKLDINKGHGPDNLPPILFKSCAESLVQPLFIIYNKSLSEGQFPTIWKCAKVIPVHKSGSKVDVTNYRPISIPSVPGKMLEAIITNELFFKLKHALGDTQHDFFRGRSIATNLSLYVQDVSEALDNRVQIDAVYTDFSKAFDKVHHPTMLIKLKNFGVHVTVAYQLWQIVGLDSSDQIEPQGSIMAPIVLYLPL
ncbi:uncharacterized protein LOC132708341 [Cylas formicarius]|uniref:uncharacterized protein LOC132708341 n=1 Tax=Cylas formicarius TaxID=197179 RepID=UPI0029587D79|nr:uncharacterized protein LOC132708341 [Cylas formicarius]